MDWQQLGDNNKMKEVNQLNNSGNKGCILVFHAFEYIGKILALSLFTDFYLITPLIKSIFCINRLNVSHNEDFKKINFRLLNTKFCIKKKKKQLFLYRSKVTTI